MTAIHSNNTLVIGASGFVGQALVRHLKTERRPLFLVSRKKDFKVPGAAVSYGDIGDREFAKKVLKNIDTVFYLAAYKKNIAVHTAKPFEVLAKNVEPFLSFLEAVKISAVKTVVYVSSINAEYASDASALVDGYVYGKYINELVARAFVAETHLNLKIVRSAAVYGPGDNFDPATANFIPALIQRVDKADKELEVWGTGERKLQYIYVDDLVKNIIATEKSPKDFFVFGNPEVVSVNGVVNKIVELIGKKLKISHDTRKPDKPTNLSQFENLVDPAIAMDVGLHQTLHYYKNHNG